MSAYDWVEKIALIVIKAVLGATVLFTFLVVAIVIGAMTIGPLLK